MPGREKSSEEEMKNLLPTSNADLQSSGDGDEEESHPSHQRWWHKCKCIDVHMIPSKLLFFLNDATQVLYLSYIIIFLSRSGLTVKEAGIISGLSMVAALIAAPIWGYLADCTKSRKLIFVILVIGSATTLFPLPWIAASLKQVDANDSTPFSSHLFFVLLAIICMFACFLSPIRGFTISFVMGIVKKTPGAEYGMQTLFGGVGVTVCSFIAGLSLDYYSSETLSPFTPVFILFLPLCLSLIPTGLVTASQAESGNKNIDAEKGSKTGRMKMLFSISNLPNVVFLLSVIISGLCNNTIGTYLFQLMFDEMQATNLVMGLARMFSGVGEIFVFIYAVRISELLGGSINCIMVSIFSFAVRFLLVSFIKNGWWVLPTQLLHGFSFALFWVSVAEYTYYIASEEIYTTVFSIVVSSYSNLGGVLGTFISGIVYNDFGGNKLFFGVGCLATCWSIFMLMFFFIYKKSCMSRKE